MKLYVIHFNDYDAPQPFGVFSTKEKAEAVCQERNKSVLYKNYQVFEYTLDAEDNPHNG